MAGQATVSTAPRPRATFGGLTFSLRQLLLGMAFVAVACLALRGASAWWVSATFSLAVALLAVGALLAVYRTGGQRAFWTGFVLCGAVHLALVLYGWHISASQNVNASHPLKPTRSTNQALLTARLSVWTYDWLFPPRPTPSSAGLGGMPGMSGYGRVGSGYDSGMDSYGGGMEYGGDGVGYDMGMPGGYMMPGAAGPAPSLGPPAPPPREPPALAFFVNVAHSLWTLLLATAGGWIALLIYTTGPRRESPEAAR